MGVLSICNKSRYSLNPTYPFTPSLSSHSKTLISSSPPPPFPAFSPSSPTTSSLFSTGHFSFSQISNPKSSKSNILTTFLCGSHLPDSFSSYLCLPNVYLLSYFGKFRSFSSSANTYKTLLSHGNFKHVELGLSSGEMSIVIDIIRNDGRDMESRLDSIGYNLSKWSIIDIMRGLNVAKVPALRFFEWVRDVHPSHYRNADVCSLMVDNCGRLEDYTTMLNLLKNFRDIRICLTEKAFGFLPLLSTTKEEAKKSIQGAVVVLNEVGGSSRNSGIHSMISLLCSLNSFDLALFVIEITEKRASYYNVLVKHLCMSGQFEEARNMIDEMWKNCCEPEATAYNFLISQLCKRGRIEKAFSVLEEMLDRGCPPDVITFEILIYFACRYGRSADAVKFYNQMVSRSIQPRPSTHCAFVRGYFNSRQFEEAYKYVIQKSEEDKLSAQEVYNELASLHLKHGDLIVAHKLLLEMIEKGLKPKNSLYRRVLNRLCKTRKEQFAKNLEARYSNLMQKFRQGSQ